jgi:biotin carboxyl carrier protein
VQYEIEIDGRVRRVVVQRTGSAFTVTVDGRAHQVDAVPVDGQSWSLLLGGQSHEVAIARSAAGRETVVNVGGMPVTALVNGRRRSGRKEDGRHGGPWAAGGPQRIVAPMPGKIVRVLAERGATVKARQPVVVIEAMKMENELRASRDGIVSEVHAREGQSVDAGVLLIVITGGTE